MMKKRLLSLLLACLMLFPLIPVSTRAATQGAYSPYPMVEYGYSPTVTVGTIRYISQVSSDGYFYSAYWPASNFGYYVGPQVECGTASMSMALSYVGENRTPDDILTPNNGGTRFTTWGNASYLSVSASNLSSAVDRYINGNGKYSPPVIHIPGYSSAGHYVVVAGRISSNQYWILDPWQRACTSMTVNGTSAVYTVYGSTIYDTIDQIHQWYNASASLDYTASCESYASYCQVKTTESTSLNSQPCYAGSNDCTGLETVAAGKTLTATKLYKNDDGELWYRVTTSGGKTGYLYAGHSTYVKNLTSDVSLSSGAAAPNGHVAGSVFVVNGTIKSDYSGLTEASVYIYSGFGTSGTAVTGGSAAVSGNSYVLDNSTIDYNTSFNGLTAGKYTYSIAAKYTNYYATGATTMKSTSGTVSLMKEYFMVISAAADQSSCSHSYETTTLKAPTCTANGTQVRSCSKCGKVLTESAAKLGHAYGAWTTTKEATCVEAGSRTRTCSRCGDVQTETVGAGGHKYVSTTLESTCQSYPGIRYTCSLCGDSYDVYDESLYSQWTTTPPIGIYAHLVQSKKQYRYADRVLNTSDQPTMDGYECIGSQWSSGTAGTVSYAPDIASTGFSTSSSLYTQYHKSKVTASETESKKVVVDSDQKTGYLYYHWCYSGSYYSVESKTGSYTTFHAYYDTTDPSTYICDTSDMSYKTSSSNCANTNWWFVTDVYTQQYTTYNKLYTHAKWGDWSGWSDTPITASDSRKVEERMVYRYVNAPYGDHTYVNGICSVCGEKDENYSSVTLTGKNFSLSFEDEILVNFYYTVSDTSKVTEQGLLVFHTNPGTPKISEADERYDEATYTSATGYYTCTTDGIAAKEMGDTRYYCAYAKLTDGSYVYSPLYEYSPKKYAMSRLANSSNAEMKALCVAMLNYGAEAQLYFRYNTNDLMNKDLTAAQKELVSTYSSGLFKGTVPVNSAKVGSFTATATGFSGKSASVSFEGAFAINYYFIPNCDIDANISFYYWNPTDYAKATALAPSNATGKLTMQKQADGSYWAQVSGIPAKELDETYYVAAFYTSDNRACCTGVIAYSLSKYCMNNAGNGSAMQGLAQGTAMYGYHAKAYFDSLSG